MEVQRDGERDGLISARNCLAAMAGADVETRQALWAAAKKYAAKDRIEAARAGRLDGSRAASVVAGVGDAFGLESW